MPQSHQLFAYDVSNHVLNLSRSRTHLVGLNQGAPSAMQSRLVVEAEEVAEDVLLVGPEDALSVAQYVVSGSGAVLNVMSPPLNSVLA